MALGFCHTLIFGSTVVAFRSAKAAALSRSERRQLTATRTSDCGKALRRFLTAIFTALVYEFIAPAGFAADLAKIDRTIVKEPAYKSVPKYCLLVFGPEAATRVWLALDGDTLYVDRNGNGDLTEAGEKVAATKNKFARPEDRTYEFEAGAIADGDRVHKGLRCHVIKLDDREDFEPDVKALLAEHREGRGYTVSCDVEMAGRKGIGIDGRVEHLASYRDTNGLLQFSETPGDAPLIHFGGPWQIGLFDRTQLAIGRQKQIVLAVGTPGLGPGTTALVGYEDLVPKDAHPEVEIVFPPEPAGSAAVRELYELKGRC